MWEGCFLSWDGGFTGELHVSHAARRRIEHWRERIEDWRERKNKTARADDVRWQIEKRGRWWVDGRSAASACETRQPLSTMLPHEPPNTSRSAATWLKVCALAHEVTPRTAASSKRWRSSVTVRAVAALSAAAIRPAVTAFPVQPRSEASTTQRASARDAMAVSADFCTYCMVSADFCTYCMVTLGFNKSRPHAHPCGRRRSTACFASLGGTAELWAASARRGRRLGRAHRPIRRRPIRGPTRPRAPE